MCSKLARWIWAQALQKRLDEYVAKYNTHTIRTQKIALPSGAPPRDIYNNPEKYGGTRAREEKLDPSLTQELVDRRKNERESVGSQREQYRQFHRTRPEHRRRKQVGVSI